MIYPYSGKPVNGALLTEEIEDLNIAGFTGWSILADGQIGVYFADAISGPAKTSLDAVIASHDSTQSSASGVDASGNTAASLAHAAAINLSPPITDLEAARTALATARTALVAAVSTYNSGDTQIQAMGASPSAAALATALKGLSANNRAVIAAQIDADQAIVDGLQALETSIKRLRTRFA